MVIGTIGYNYVHDMRKERFEMNCPKGQGAPVFLIVKTPSKFVIGGQEYKVKENSVILLRAETPCSYTADGDFYTDDWLYFEWQDWDYGYFERLGLPLDIPVHLGNTEELSQIMHILSYEHYTSDKFHSAIEERYIDILFLTLARMLTTKNIVHSKAYSEKNYRFSQIRTEIYTKPDTFKDVDDMAASVGMSRSGFQHLYKKMFGVSVIYDVISARVHIAKRLLAVTNLTVREIALRCGYTNEYSFMRQFKQREGKTPTEYRNCI